MSSIPVFGRHVLCGSCAGAGWIPGDIKPVRIDGRKLRRRERLTCQTCHGTGLQLASVRDRDQVAAR